MPNRIIKENIRTSKDVNNLSDFMFRLWAYLITYVDDFGRGSADPELLKGIVFPRRKVSESQIQNAMNELQQRGMIVIYSVNGEPYFYFPTWDKHQSVRAKKSKFPAPMKASASNCMQMQADENESSRNPILSNTLSESNASGAKFTPPTLEEVKAYCSERRNSINPERFISYYEAQGWKLSNGLVMKDWKAAVRSWETRDKSKPRNYGSENYDQKTIRMEDLTNFI